MSSSKSSSSSSEANAPLFPDRLQDVACNVEIILGTGNMSVRDCLSLKHHSVIRLTQPAGSDLQVRVNGVAIAQCEIVVIDDSTSVRLTEILPPPSASSTP